MIAMAGAMGAMAMFMAMAMGAMALVMAMAVGMGAMAMVMAMAIAFEGYVHSQGHNHGQGGGLATRIMNADWVKSYIPPCNKTTYLLSFCPGSVHCLF